MAVAVNSVGPIKMLMRIGVRHPEELILVAL